MRRFGLLMVSVAGMVFAGSAALADAAASAPAPAATATTTTTTQSSDLDKVVCRTMTAPTGTRIGARRECLTQRAWDDIRQQSEKDTSKMQENRGIVSPGKQ